MRARPLRSSVVPFLTVVVSSLAAPAFAAAPSGPRAERARPDVLGGQSAATCQWPSSTIEPTPGGPSASSGSGGGCSGTLIAPSVVVFAAHCMSEGLAAPVTVQFGEAMATPGQTVDVGTCTVNPSWKAGAANGDIAFCTLKAPVTEVPPTPPLVGCEASVLTQGTPVVLVGYDDRPTPRVKTWVSTIIDGPPTNGNITLGTDTQTTCNGDSGGSAFVQVSDGTWRAIGVTSHGAGGSPDGGCNTPSVDTYVGDNVHWIETASAIDVTPCFDYDSATSAYVWAPTAACGGFALDPGADGGAWATWCGGPGAVSGLSSTCGAPFGGDAGGALVDGGASDAGLPDAAGDPDGGLTANDGGSPATGVGAGAVTGASGCGCRVTGNASPAWGSLASFLGLGLAVARRRKRAAR